ncbi:pentatricopeptide repeat-containing protein [Quercus suber]|uniref:Pentatricopeptide repeat-containing protein n=1 Tax=Quercus suber TaxID=58331 RepID=A0AAW0JUV9_QUESU
MTEPFVSVRSICKLNLNRSFNPNPTTFKVPLGQPPNSIPQWLPPKRVFPNCPPTQEQSPPCPPLLPLDSTQVSLPPQPPHILHHYPHSDPSPALDPSPFTHSDCHSDPMTYRLCGSAPFVFDLLVKACLEIKKIDSAIEIVRMLRSRGISPKVGTLNDLVYWVLKVRGGCVGYEVYREVFGLEGDGVVGNVKRVYKVWPNVHTFNVLMGGFYQDGMVEKVEMIWNEMVGFDCVPNCYSYSVLMAVYCEEGRMGEAEKLWEEMRVKEVEADVVSYNTMIGGFCKIGEVEKAEELYREMGLNGVESSCATYEHLVNGYCNVGDVDSALLVYKDMCRKGFRPEALTLDVVIGGLCVKGRVYEAVEILRGGVEDFGLVPKGKSYETLLKGLCEEGRMEEALKIQAEMVGKGFEPNLEIYGAFIEGYVGQGNEEMVEVLRNEVLEKQMRGKREVDDSLMDFVLETKASFWDISLVSLENVIFAGDFDAVKQGFIYSAYLVTCKDNSGRHLMPLVDICYLFLENEDSTLMAAYYSNDDRIMHQERRED